jgi:hypothetical protein
MTLYPVLLLLPYGRRLEGAIKACDWETAVRYAESLHPGVVVHQTTIEESPSLEKLAPVAARRRA